MRGPSHTFGIMRGLDPRIHNEVRLGSRGFTFYSARESAAAAVEACAFFIELQARPDVADVERQIAWCKAQSLIDKGVNARRGRSELRQVTISSVRRISALASLPVA